MSWLPHKELRPVGLPWLGDVPASWSLKKFRYCFRESAEKNGDTPVGEMLSVSGYRGVEVKQYEDENRRRTVDELADYRVVRKGQLAVNTMWLNYAGLGVSAFEGHVSPAYRAYWIDPGLEHRYINYLMRSSAYVDGYTALLTGIRPNSLQMGRNDLMNFPILCPPLDDQKMIADFLDRETPKIDALIAKQEQMIATLREDRTATITHAVTKGLVPDVPLKDFPVRWLDQCPSHWLALPLKYLVSMRSGVGITSEAIDDAGQYPVYGGNGLRGYTIDATHHGDFILVGRQGALCGNVHKVSGDFWASEHAIVCTPVAHFNLGWLTYLLTAMNLGQYSQAAAQPGLSADVIGNLRVPVPPIEEQEAITLELDDQGRRIDRLVDKAGEVVRTLHEYRSALITDAVTGKIDVRGAA